jgi:hypothetical protein
MSVFWPRAPPPPSPPTPVHRLRVHSAPTAYPIWGLAPHDRQPPSIGRCLPVLEPSHGSGSGRLGPFQCGRGRLGGAGGGGGGGGASRPSRSNLSCLAGMATPFSSRCRVPTPPPPPRRRRAPPHFRGTQGETRSQAAAGRWRKTVAHLHFGRGVGDRESQPHQPLGQLQGEVGLDLVGVVQDLALDTAPSVAPLNLVTRTERLHRQILVQTTSRIGRGRRTPPSHSVGGGAPSSSPAPSACCRRPRSRLAVPRP